MIFSNIFLESKYGNLFIKKKDKYYEIFSKEKNLKRILNQQCNLSIIVKGKENITYLP